MGWDSSLWAEDADNADRYCRGSGDEPDCRSHNSSPVRMKAQRRFNRTKGMLNRSCSVPDSNNPPGPTPPHGNISVPVSDLTEIGADEHLCCKSLWGNRSKRLTRGRSCESYPRRSAEDCVSSLANYSRSRANADAVEASCDEESNSQDCHENAFKEESQDVTPSCTSASPNPVDVEYDNFGAKISKNHKSSMPKNYMTKSMLFLNEESPDEVSKLLVDVFCLHLTFIHGLNIRGLFLTVRSLHFPF